MSNVPPPYNVQQQQQQMPATLHLQQPQVQQPQMQQPQVIAMPVIVNQNPDNILDHNYVNLRAIKILGILHVIWGLLMLGPDVVVITEYWSQLTFMGSVGGLWAIFAIPISMCCLQTKSSRARLRVHLGMNIASIVFSFMAFMFNADGVRFFNNCTVNPLQYYTYYDGSYPYDRKVVTSWNRDCGYSTGDADSGYALSAVVMTASLLEFITALTSAIFSYKGSCLNCSSCPGGEAPAKPNQQQTLVHNHQQQQQPNVMVSMPVCSMPMASSMNQMQPAVMVAMPSVSMQQPASMAVTSMPAGMSMSMASNGMQGYPMQQYIQQNQQAAQVQPTYSQQYSGQSTEASAPQGEAPSPRVAYTGQPEPTASMGFANPMMAAENEK